MERNIIFKINHQGDLRRWTAGESTVSMDQLLDRTAQLFSLPRDDALLRYEDDEGDMITLANDDDLAEAVSVADLKAGNKLVLRLDVVSPKPARGASAAEPSSVRDDPRVKQLEAQAAKLEEEAKKAAKHAEKMAHAMEKEAKKAAKKAAKEAEKAAKHAEKAVHDAIPAFMATPAGAMLEQVITALTPRGDNPGQGPPSTPREAMERLSDLVTQLATVPPTGSAPAPAEEPHEDAPAVHPHVTCDVSGMNPIVGPRFKKKGANYDLCEAEFAKLSLEEQAHFIRIDTPDQVWRPSRCGGRRCSGRPCGAKSVKPQARFVGDVNIPDNTEILPGTLFTKIWRLRNTGEAPWPSDTKLVCVGGDPFEGDTVTDVSAPVAAGGEVDVAVSLVAPPMPGRYVSYWRLAEPPSMRKFGQRIWVQVVIVNKDGTVEFQASEEEEKAIHVGVECDASGMHPIVGPRFNKKGMDYDLCEAEFAKLDEAERGQYLRIDHPGAAPIDLASGRTVIFDELEARLGWSSDMVAIVGRSALTAEMERLQGILPQEVADALMEALEPLFAVPPEHLEHCLIEAEQSILAGVYDAAVAGVMPDLDRVHEMVAFHAAAFSEVSEDGPSSAVVVEEHEPMGPCYTGDMIDLVGAYSCSAYPPEEQNDWHFVDLRASADGDHLIWTNRAEVEWRLMPTQEPHAYHVADECPYSETHPVMRIEVVDGAVTLRGPHGEPYTAVAVSQEEDLYDEPEADLPAVPVVEEEPTGEESCGAWSIPEAVAQLGLEGDDLSASTIADIEQAVAANAEEAERLAAEESLRIAQDVEAKAAEEARIAEEARLAAEAKAAEEARIAEEARLAAEAEATRQEEAARITAEAEAKAAEKAANLAPEMAPLVASLVAMGFGEDAARSAIAATEGNVEEAANILLLAGGSANAPAPALEPEPEFPARVEVVASDTFPVDEIAPAAAPADPASWKEEWDDLLEELVEMGFEDNGLNRELLQEANGNVKDAVKELVTRERSLRSESGSDAQSDTGSTCGA